MEPSLATHESASLFTTLNTLSRYMTTFIGDVGDRQFLFTICNWIMIQCKMCAREEFAMIWSKRYFSIQYLAQCAIIMSFLKWLILYYKSCDISRAGIKIRIQLLAGSSMVVFPWCQWFELYLCWFTGLVLNQDII